MSEYKAKPTASGLKVLTQLAQGATLRAWRTYPYSPFRYTLKLPATDSESSKEKDLSLGLVSGLVGYQWLKPVPQDELWDNIEYHLTEAGRQVVDEVAA